jgi:transposase
LAGPGLAAANKLTTTEAELVRQSSRELWAEQAAFLVQLPGIGVHNAMLLLAAIGDIRRFDAAHKLVGYAGLGARVHSSGEEHYGGRISKQGRRDIRSTMVEAAWVAVGGHPYWKELFERLAVRVGKPKAIVAIARKMLLVVWHVLTKRRPRGGCRAGRWQVPGVVVETGACQSRWTDLRAFIRRELRRLQLGENVTTITRGKRTFPIPLAEHAEQAVG